MEYLPYKIEEGSHNIEIFMNEYHGLLTFSSIEEGKNFFRKKAVKPVKWEDGGEKAQNCIYSTEQVTSDLYTVKDGLFVEELEDGFALKRKVPGTLYGATVTPIHYYLLCSFTHPIRHPSATLGQGGVEHDEFKDALVAELRSKNFGEVLKKTGNLSTLMASSGTVDTENKERADPVPEEEDDFEEALYVVCDVPDTLPDFPELPPLPPLPPSPSPIFHTDTIDTMIQRVMVDEEVQETIYWYEESEEEEEEAEAMRFSEEMDSIVQRLETEIQQIEENYRTLEREEKRITLKLKKLQQDSDESTLSTAYSSSESEEEESSSEDASSESEEEESSNEDESSESEEEESSSEDESSSSFWHSTLESSEDEEADRVSESR